MTNDLDHEYVTFHYTMLIVQLIHLMFTWGILAQNHDFHQVLLTFTWTPSPPPLKRLKICIPVLM